MYMQKPCRQKVWRLAHGTWLFLGSLSGRRRLRLRQLAVQVEPVRLQVVGPVEDHVTARASQEVLCKQHGLQHEHIQKALLHV